MLSNNLTVPGTPSRTFNLRSMNDNGENLRGDPTASVLIPRTLTTSSQKKGKPGEEYQRIYIRFDYGLNARPNGSRPVCSGHVVYNVPLEADAAAAAEEIRTQITALVTGSNLTLMINGEA